MTEDERVRAYLRARADVPVPDDLRWPAAASAPRRRWAFPLVAGWGRVAVAGLVMAVIVVVVGVSLGLPGSPGPGGLSTPAASGPGPSASATPNAIFPSRVAGLPVVTVARGAELLQSGRLDGQAVAVAGYFDQMFLPCPYPGRYVGPLEDWCREVAFTDTQADAQLCHPEGSNGTSCGEPSGTYLAPFFMTETSGSPSSWLTGTQPVALVLIGHAGDARQWQCRAATQAACANAFVVDRIAWAEGQAVPPVAPQIGDQQTGKPIASRMTLAQVAGVLGLGDDLLTGAALPASEVATVDPRWNLAGADLVWLVRSLAPAVEPAAETRPETVWLVDDATGRVIDSHGLQLAAGYRPARLWQVATVHGTDCCSGDLFAFDRVTSGGTVVHEGLVSQGESGGPDGITFGSGYESPGPLVLSAGRYSATVWLATYGGGVMGTPRDTCSTQVTLGPLDDVTLEADFPSGQACTFQQAPTPSTGP